jgi:hypothetical protein
VTAIESRAGAPRIGRVARLKLTEPLLLYVVPTSLLLALVVIVPTILAGAWPALVLEVPALALHGVAVWAARRSTYSPAGTIRAIRDAMAAR